MREREREKEREKERERERENKRERESHTNICTDIYKSFVNPCRFAFFPKAFQNLSKLF